jgi:CheY-like chemotaxis protein
METNRNHSLRILLVDDNIDNRNLIIAYLKKTPHKIDIAENGEIALKKFKENQYDIVLMDIQMPIMDGYTATREIRDLEQSEKKRATPIIALTAFATLEDAVKSIEAGCNEHLTKPITKNEFLEFLEGYFNKK